MVNRAYFDPVTRDGRTLGDRLVAHGIRVALAAENIAAGQPDAAAALAAWLNSPPHRVNLEECRFTHHGMGEYRSRWTHILLVPRGSS
jgi:uncharacterized protein YkwD